MFKFSIAFKITDGFSKSSGSQSLCQITSPQPGGTSSVPCRSTTGLSVSLGFMTIITVILIIGAIALGFYVYYSRYRINYKEILQ